jgi:hypothetical protein
MDYSIPVVQPNNLADEIGKWGNINAQRQQQRLIDMKMQQAPEEMAMQRQLHQAQMSDHAATAGLNEGKAQEQKMAFVGNVSKMILGRAKSTGLDPNSPEYQQAVNQAGAPFRAQMAAVFGHEDDPSKPIDINALNSLANYNAGGEHQKVIYTQQHGADGEYSFNGATGETTPIMQGGKHLQAAQYNPALQGQIQREKQANTGHVLEGADGSKGLYSGAQANPAAFGGPSQFAGQVPLTSEQAQQLPTTEATQQDVNNFPQMKISPSGQALGLKIEPGKPITGPTMQEVETVKRASNIAEAEAKKNIEVNKATEITQAKNANSAHAMLSRLGEKIDGKSIDELIDQSTGSGAGVIRDGVMNFMGKTTDAANAAAALKTVEGWLTSSVPRMEGPQGEKDVALYKSMAADIGDPSVPPEQKKKKLLALRAMMQDQGRAAPIQGKSQDIHSLADDILRGK